MIQARWGIAGTAVAMLCLLAGCSSTASGRDGATDTTTTTGGMCGAGIPAGQECNAVKATGAAITPTCVTATMPAGTGGTILDGTYELTSVTYYTNCSREPVSETVVVSGNCLEIATGTPFPATASGTFTVAGTTLLTMLNCFHIDLDGATTMPRPSSNNAYSATSTSLTLFNPGSTDGGSTSSTVAVFTKR